VSLTLQVFHCQVDISYCFLRTLDVQTREQTFVQCQSGLMLWLIWIFGNENYFWVICSKLRSFVLLGLLWRHCVFGLFELLQSPSFIWKRVLIKNYTVTLHFYITISHLFFVSCAYMHAWMHECMNAWMHECMNACTYATINSCMRCIGMEDVGGEGRDPNVKKKNSVPCWKLQSSLELGMSVHHSINGTRFLYSVF